MISFRFTGLGFLVLMISCSPPQVNRNKEFGNKLLFDTINDTFVIGYPAQWFKDSVVMNQNENVNFAVISNRKNSYGFRSNFHLVSHEKFGRKTRKELKLMSENFFLSQVDAYSDYDFDLIGDGFIKSSKHIETYWVDYSVVNNESKLYSINCYVSFSNTVVQLNFYSHLKSRKELEKIFNDVMQS